MFCFSINEHLLYQPESSPQQKVVYLFVPFVVNGTMPAILKYLE